MQRSQPASEFELTTEHDFQTCDLPICERCSDASTGYEAGRRKAYFDLSHHLEAGHGVGCACRNCIVTRILTGGRRPVVDTPLEMYPAG